jgi:predicted aldo/keto reductase-like oxidoreductase
MVSALGFGAMRLPTLEDGTCDYEKSVPLLQRGIDLGINYIDTAYVYIKGTSEVAVGKAIKKYDREKLYLATKIPTNDEKDSDPDVWQRKLDECLTRLDTPYIDFLLFHGCTWKSFSEHISKSGRALDVARKAQAEGLIRHLCFSSHDDPQNVIRLLDTGEFASVLLQYNYLDEHNLPAIEHAAQKGVGVAVMGPVAGGRLFVPGGVVRDDEGGLEVKTPELALRFVWGNPDVSVALSGMNTMAQIEENVAAAEKAELNESENARIHEMVQRNQKLSDL